jgi:hypothetical protein
MLPQLGWRAQGHALPHVKSNRRKGRASRKNQTIGEEKKDNTGIAYHRSTYGVDFERTKKTDTAYR